VLGDCELEIGDWTQSTIPNPQSTIHNPQSPILALLIYKIFNLKS